jgi:hypothetical protein
MSTLDEAVKAQLVKHTLIEVHPFADDTGTRVAATALKAGRYALMIDFGASRLTGSEIEAIESERFIHVQHNYRATAEDLQFFLKEAAFAINDGFCPVTLIISPLNPQPQDAKAVRHVLRNFVMAAPKNQDVHIVVVSYGRGIGSDEAKITDLEAWLDG